jgi:RNA polymerase sigma-70 factor (ECF subfamily)
LNPTDLDEDRRLVAAAKSDPARFVDLYDRHFHRVYAYALRRTKSRVDAEDITSDVFHRALVNLRKYEWRGKPFVAWLFRIAANAIADKREETPDAGVDPPVEIEAVDPDLERQAMLFQLVDRLPDEQRRVIEMRFGEGRSLLEVARAIGKSDGAVKQIQRRALEQLRRDLETSHG